MSTVPTSTNRTWKNPLEVTFEYSIDERESQIMCQFPGIDRAMINLILCAELRRALFAAEVRLCELEGSLPLAPA